MTQMREILILLCILVTGVTRFSVAGVQEERFLKPIGKLSPVFKGSEGETLSRLIQSDLRFEVFKLEALFRIYEKMYGDLERNKRGAAAEKLRKEIKKFEDRLGQFSDSQKLVKWMESRVGSETDQEVLKEFENHQARSRKDLAEIIRDWKSKGRIESLANDIDYLIDYEYLEERQYLLIQLSENLKKVHKKKYDLSKLEGPDGIHELRRDLRWFAITATALNGMVTLSKKGCPNRAFKNIQESDLDLKYSKLPRTQEKACPIAECAYFALLKVIKELGELKDLGQRHAAVVSVLLDRKMVRERKQAVLHAERLVGKSLQSIHLESEKLYHWVMGTDLLKELRKSLKDCVQ